VTAAKEKTQDGRGKFFAIDGRAWRFVCKLGLNAACAYLVLARGTGPDNRTTAWSAHAVENYTAISRSRARATIVALEAAGVLRRVPGRSASKPLYKLAPAHEIPGCAGYPPTPMGADQAKLHTAMGADWVKLPSYAYGPQFKVWKVHTPLTVAEELAEVGRVEFRKDGRCRAIHYDAQAASQPTWIWLPNALVDGAADETPSLQ
jgi:hypothetical protein